MDTKKYLPGPAAFFSAGPDYYIAYNFIKKTHFIISKQDAYNYSHLSGIKNLELHLEDLLKQNNPDRDIYQYKKLLDLLIQENLLCPLAECRNNTNQHNICNSAVMLLTYNRPELLSNTMESIAEGIYKNNPDIPIMVFDDSVDNNTAEGNRRITAKIGNKFRLKTGCFGITEKRSYLEKLEEKTKEKGIEKEILDFAFFGDPEFSLLIKGGGNRNSALLKLAGNKIISFDDDIQYNFIEKNRQNNEFAIQKIPETNLFDDIKKITGKYNKTDRNIITCINAILGKSVMSVITKGGNTDKKIYSEDYRPVNRFSITEQCSSIKTAMLGIYGGKWYSSPYSFYFNNGSERNRSFKKKSEYIKIKEEPVSLLLPECLCISRIPFLISTALGIDARKITPPFPPVLRACDHIWITIMLALENHSFVSYLPYAVYHEISHKTPFIQKDYENTSPESNILLVLFIEQIQRNLLSVLPEITYNILGNQLIKISQLDDKSFVSLCHDQWLSYTGSAIDTLEKRLLEYKKKPRHWAADVKDYISLLEEKSVNPENSLPRDFLKNYSIPESIRLFKLFIQKYGRLIKSWPVIWEEAVKLNKKEGALE